MRHTIVVSGLPNCIEPLCTLRGGLGGLRGGLGGGLGGEGRGVLRGGGVLRGREGEGGVLRGGRGGVRRRGRGV